MLEFEQLKTQIVNLLKMQFPDRNNDFSIESNGQMIVELFSALGSVLSHNIDQGYTEALWNKASKNESILELSKNIGYKTKPIIAASGKIHLTLTLPLLNGQPNLNYGLVVLPGTTFSGENGETYTLSSVVDFSQGIDVTGKVLIEELENDQYVLDKSVQGTKLVKITKVGVVYAGDTKVHEEVLNDFQSNLELKLPELNITEIISVVDSEGNTWNEVNYLAEDMKLDEKFDIVYLLRRFEIKYDNDGYTYLKFGSGQQNNSSFPSGYDAIYRTNKFTGAINPNKFLSSTSLGLTPFDTTLTILYRQCLNGGAITNLNSSHTLNEVLETKAYLKDYNSVIGDYDAFKNTYDSLEVTNYRPIVGGRDALTLEEIKSIAPQEFASQKRCITKEDYLARIFSMPSSFGQVYKCNLEVIDNILKIWILLKDSSGKLLKASTDFKTILVKYLTQYKPIMDVIEIEDGAVFNLAIDYALVIHPDFIPIGQQIIAQCNLKISEYFDTSKRKLGDYISLSELTSKLHEIKGVKSVESLKISSAITSPNKTNLTPIGGIITATNKGMFEIFSPLKDIKGKIVNYE